MKLSESDPLSRDPELIAALRARREQLRLDLEVVLTAWKKSNWREATWKEPNGCEFMHDLRREEALLRAKIDAITSLLSRAGADWPYVNPGV